MVVIVVDATRHDVLPYDDLSFCTPTECVRIFRSHSELEQWLKKFDQERRWLIKTANDAEDWRLQA
jgi:hypothetical protein